jgi:hypothetical protein
VTERRDAVVEDLRALADDLKSLLESSTTDPKERRRKERRWRLLYGAFAVVTTLAARRTAAKVWAILTGEKPPMQRPAQPPPRQTHAAPEGEIAEERAGQQA